MLERSKEIYARKMGRENNDWHSTLSDVIWTIPVLYFDWRTKNAFIALRISIVFINLINSTQVSEF